ncbi:MAG: hypothetical protein ACFFG0_48720 [Candidatus Thorarchaeota archaeon]
MMYKGRSDSLKGELMRLSRIKSILACLIIDERGLVVSEFSKFNIDKNAMAVMSSLLVHSSNRFIPRLKLENLISLSMYTLEGSLIIKEIPIPQLKRKFILSLLIKNRGNNGNGRSKLKKFFNFTKSGNLNLSKEIDQTIKTIQTIFNQ